MNWKLIEMIIVIQITFVCTFLWLGIVWNAIMKVKMEKSWELQLSFQKELFKMQNPISPFTKIMEENFNDQP